jgi:hypothetical protein
MPFAGDMFGLDPQTFTPKEEEEEESGGQGT